MSDDIAIGNDEIVSTEKVRDCEKCNAGKWCLTPQAMKFRNSNGVDFDNVAFRNVSDEIKINTSLNENFCFLYCNTLL